MFRFPQFGSVWHEGSRVLGCKKVKNRVWGETGSWYFPLLFPPPLLPPQWTSSKTMRNLFQWFLSQPWFPTIHLDDAQGQNTPTGLEEQMKVVGKEARKEQSPRDQRKIDAHSNPLIRAWIATQRKCRSFIARIYCTPSKCTFVWLDDDVMLMLLIPNATWPIMICRLDWNKGTCKFAQIR